MPWWELSPCPHLPFWFNNTTWTSGGGSIWLTGSSSSAPNDICHMCSVTVRLGDNHYLVIVASSLITASEPHGPKKPLAHLFNILFSSEVAQLCLTPCDPMDCSLPGSFVHGILQTRILEWIAISFSRGSFRPRDRTQVSCPAGGTLYRLSHQGSPFCFKAICFQRWCYKPWSCCLYVWISTVILGAAEQLSVTYLGPTAHGFPGTRVVESGLH